MTPERYRARVLQLEAEGLTTSDAQAAVDAEEMQSACYTAPVPLTKQAPMFTDSPDDFTLTQPEAP
jgi:hypothetical protein